MNCRSVQRRLTEDLKSAPQDPLLRKHLGECPKCQTISRELLSLEELSRELGESPSPAPDFPSARPYPGPVGRVWRHSWKPVFALSLAAVLSLGILWIGASGGPVAPTGKVLTGVSAQQPVNSLQETRTLPVETNDVAAPYVEILLEKSSQQEHVLRLPPTIEVRRMNLHHDFDLRHVSH